MNTSKWIRWMTTVLVTLCLTIACDDGTLPDDPCDGVTCSFHGTCFVSDGTARCDCAPGYLDEGLACVSGTDGDADSDVDIDSDVDGDGDGDVDGDGELDGDEESCVPDCVDRECGSDGCDGSCEPGCADDRVCDGERGVCRDMDWTLEMPADSVGTRSHAAMAFDEARGVAVFFGGQSSVGTSSMNDSWVWNGTTWTRVTPESRPPSRTGHNLVYDGRREMIVLFGGINASDGQRDDIWEWDGASWTYPSFSGDRPGERSSAAMTYDEGNGVTVLFGGRRYLPSEVDLGDTWLWDGTHWEEVASGSGPPGRAGAFLVYDDARGVAVLFGGGTNTGTIYSETWEWDGSSWTDVTPTTGPSPETARQMVFDSGRGVTVLFGGDADGTYLQPENTWEWDGVAWNEVTTVSTPPQRRAHGAIAYDSIRQEVVLHGGTYLDDTGFWRHLDDTWTFGPGS